MSDDEFHIRVNDYKFACLIEDLLSGQGLGKTGAGIDFEGWRDLWYKRFEIPDKADFIPEPIEVNLPQEW